MNEVINFVQSNWELLVAVVSLILSWVAVLKSQAAIQSGDRQFLFDRRVDAYILLRDLVSGYEQSKCIFPSDARHGAPDFVYAMLCNVESLEDIQGEARHWEDADSQLRFMLKIEGIRKMAIKFGLLYPDIDVTKVALFIQAYADTLVKLRAYHVAVEEHVKRLNDMPDVIRNMQPTNELDNIYKMVATGEHGLDKSIAVLHENAKALDETYFRKLEKQICLRERRF